MSHIEFKGLPNSSTLTSGVDRIVMDEAERSMNNAVHRAHSEVLSRMARHRRTGHMMRGVTTRVQRVGSMVVGLIGTNVFYTPFHEFGTGLYGPRHRWIVPKRAQALRFPQPGNRGFTLAGRQRSGKAGANARWVYAKRVRGIRPLRYFRDTAHVVNPYIDREFEAGAKRAAVRIGHLMTGRAS
jgi:hypothetical protein